MSKLPSLKPREVEKILRKAGFLLDVQKGSHRAYCLQGILQGEALQI